MLKNALSKLKSYQANNWKYKKLSRNLPYNKLLNDQQHVKASLGPSSEGIVVILVHPKKSLIASVSYSMNESFGLIKMVFVIHNTEGITEKKQNFEFINIAGSTVGRALNTVVSNSTSNCFLLFDSEVECIYFESIQKIARQLDGLSNNAISYFDSDFQDADSLRSKPIFRPRFNQEYFICYDFIGSNIGFKSKHGVIHFNDGLDKLADVTLDYINSHLKQGFVPLKINEIIYSNGFESSIKVSNNFELKSELLSERFSLSKHKNVFKFNANEVSNDRISIIIPFKDGLELLRQCVKSIVEKTTYSNYDILLVDNNSVKQETKDYLSLIQASDSKIKVINANMPFNFSAINNFAVKQTSAPFVLFLNNDTKVINKNWLTEMKQLMEDEKVAVVGAKLFYEDGSIQHAGVIHKIGHVAGHIFNGFDGSSPGYENRLDCIQQYMAVTAACMLTKKSLFTKVGGFDEENLAIAYNDIDFCYKLFDLGYKIIFTPHAQLYHYESKSRKHDLSRSEKKRFNKEVNFMKEKWFSKYPSDPFYHEYLQEYPQLLKSFEE